MNTIKQPPKPFVFSAKRATVPLQDYLDLLEAATKAYAALKTIEDKMSSAEYTGYAMLRDHLANVRAKIESGNRGKRECAHKWVEGYDVHPILGKRDYHRKCSKCKKIEQMDSSD